MAADFLDWVGQTPDVVRRRLRPQPDSSVGVVLEPGDFPVDWLLQFPNNVPVAVVLRRCVTLGFQLTLPIVPTGGGLETFTDTLLLRQDFNTNTDDVNSIASYRFQEPL